MNRTKNDVVIQHTTPTLTEYKSTSIPQNQQVFSIDYQNASEVRNLYTVGSEHYSDSRWCIVPVGFVEEVKKRLFQQDFYVNARKKANYEKRIIRHAVTLLQINLLNVTRWRDDSDCKYLNKKDWNKFYKQDNQKGYRYMSQELLDTVCGENRKHRRELMKVLTSPLLSNPTPETFSDQCDYTDYTATTNNTEYSIENRSNDTVIVGLDRAPQRYPEILQQKRDSKSGRASNIFRLNPYIMRQSRDSTDILSDIDLKHLALQKMFVIQKYGYGRKINAIEAENMQKLKLISLKCARAILEALKGQEYKDEGIIDDNKVEELLKVYQTCKKEIDAGKFSILKKSENRHYTALQRIPRPIRKEIAKVNKRSEPDFKSLHPNIVFSLLLGRLNTEFLKEQGFDIDWFYDSGIIPELSDSSRQWLESVAGNVKLNLAVYYDGDVALCKKENISYYNTYIKEHKNYKLHLVYQEHCPELVEFIENMKHTDHRKMSNFLMKIEAVIMEYITFSCDSRGIIANGIHDSIMVPENDSKEVKNIMNSVAGEIGLTSYVE